MIWSKTNRNEKTPKAIPHGREPICFGCPFNRGTTLGGVSHEKLEQNRERLDKTKLAHNKIRTIDIRARRQLGRVSTSQHEDPVESKKNTKFRSARWHWKRPSDLGWP